MEDHELLVRRALSWAGGKGRDLDDQSLTEALTLRHRHDDLAPTYWPVGSAERPLLVTWPGYGSAPDVDGLSDTLDTFWMFLRATGRLASGSAMPAELRKEMKRCLPHMREAYDDPARHSQGRVLADFGRSIGIEPEGAATAEELQGRLDQIQTAWNELPVDERFRLMPDASPKGAVGADLTGMVRAMSMSPDSDVDDAYEDKDAPGIEPGDLRVSARLARESAYVRRCLALAAWVGEGRQATNAGLLRPAVAREAYRHLDLWPWEREFDACRRRTYGLESSASIDPEVDRLVAESALNAWRSAGDCLALDRLWYACDAADLVHVGATKAVRRRPDPTTDEEWRDLAIVLLIGMCLRLGQYPLEPLAGLMLMAHVEGSAALEDVRSWWDSRCPPSLRDYFTDGGGWQARLDEAIFHFADCKLWEIDGTVRLTDLGRDFLVTYLGAVDAGLIPE